jgi:hypothetical protein
MRLRHLLLLQQLRLRRRRLLRLLRLLRLMLQMWLLLEGGNVLHVRRRGSRRRLLLEAGGWLRRLRQLRLQMGLLLEADRVKILQVRLLLQGGCPLHRPTQVVTPKLLASRKVVGGQPNKRPRQRQRRAAEKVGPMAQQRSRGRRGRLGALRRRAHLLLASATRRDRVPRHLVNLVLIRRRRGGPDLCNEGGRGAAVWGRGDA